MPMGESCRSIWPASISRSCGRGGRAGRAGRGGRGGGAPGGEGGWGRGCGAAPPAFSWVISARPGERRAGGGLLARVQAVDPALFQTIDAARPMEAQRGDVLLELGAHRVLLNRDAGPEVIEAVVLVARDLAAKARPYAELDARFAGQVVVRRRSAGSV